MEKVLWLFRRKEGLSRRAFHEHYAGVHAPLAMCALREIEGYTVNLVESDGTELDAVTELWTPSAADMLAAATFRTPRAKAALISDHKSFQGPQDAFVVEEDVRVDGILAAAGEGHWAKSVSVHRRGEAPEEPHPGAFRVVDNRVARTMLVRDRPVREGSGADVVRMIWADDPGILPAPGPTTVHVREMRNVLPPA